MFFNYFVPSGFFFELTPMRKQFVKKTVLKEDETFNRIVYHSLTKIILRLYNTKLQHYFDRLM